MADILEIRLLGPVQIQRAGQPIRGFESRKALALLCYLAARDQPLTRDHLADLFWPDKTPQQGRANLSRVLHNLNSLVPGSLTIDRYTVSFRQTADCWLDVAAFEQLASRRTQAAQAAAAVLFRGDFMADVFLDDCPDFELWLVGARERWLAKVTRVLDDLVEHHLHQRTFAEGLDVVSRLLELEPWREAAHRQAMLLWAKCGRPAEALAQYEACRRALEEGLASQPSAETSVLFDQIRAGQIAEEVSIPRPEPPHNLPIQLTSFVGREGELATIAARLADPACRLLTLVGPGGIGKTRLALEAAARAKFDFTDGSWLVRLASLGAPEFIITTIADAVTFTFAPAGDPTEQLLEYLAPKQILLIMDSFEHLVAGADGVIEILRRAPQAKLLVTSRVPLDFQAEWLVPIHGLVYTAATTIGGADAHETFSALRLFTERARQRLPDFALNETTRLEVASICRSVEGMPLAIELAAGWVDSLSCAAIAGQIADNLDVLVTTMRDIPARQRSMRAVLDQTWNLLAEHQQQILAALSVFRGGFEADAAIEVTGATPSILAVLTSKFLLSSRGDQRFDMHDLMRQYALDKLVASGGEQRTRERHLTYFLAFSEQAEPYLTGPKQRIWLDRLEHEYDNLSTALAWSLGRPGTAERGLRLVVALRWLWERRGRLAEGGKALTWALEAAGTAPAALRAKALNAMGCFAYRLADFESARQIYEECLAILQNLDDELGAGLILGNLGMVALWMGEIDTAYSDLSGSLAICKQHGDMRGSGYALINLGNTHEFLRDFEAARDAYEEALKLFRALRDPNRIAGAQENLASLYHRTGDLAKALDALDGVLEIQRDLGDTWGIANTLDSLCAVHLSGGDHIAARDTAKESLTMFHRLGDTHGIASGLERWAHIALATGERQRATRLFARADALREAIRFVPPADERLDFENGVAAARTALGTPAFEAAWERGRALSPDDAVAYALGQLEDAPAVISETGEAARAIHRSPPNPPANSEGFTKT